MTLKPLLGWGMTVAVLVSVLMLGKTDTAFAQATFNPELNLTLTTPQPEVTSDYTVDINIPKGDVNFAGVVAFIPGEWGIVTGDKIPVGADVGHLTSTATLGLINGACNTELPVEFEMKNATIDRSKTVSFQDEDENNTRDFAEDLINPDGNDDAIDLYPDFLDRIVDAQPIRRSAGITLVAGTPVLLQFLVYPPGTEIDEDIPSDPDLGFPSVTFLQNAGDPEPEPEPGIITDFCTPLITQNVTFGATPEGDQLAVTPTDGTYEFTVFALGQRDPDGDSYETTLDTCSQIPNNGDPRVPNDADADSDGLDSACDPNDNQTNSDEDADGYQNRQDNCPLDANGENEDNQQDTDEDQIGDACDKNPDEKDGELIPVQPKIQIDIGSGGGSPGDPPSKEVCPNCWDENWSYGGSGGGGGDDDDGEPTEDNGTVTEDDDGGSSALPIVIGVVAAIAIIGGGAAFFLRRRNAG